MERIKEALERARVERERGAGGQPVEVAGAAPPAQGKSTIRSATSAPAASRGEVIQLDRNHLEERRILAHNKHDTHSRAFDLLRTQVLQMMAAGGWRTIGIASPGLGVGKSTVAINLALSIAQLADHTAMLVDFDLRAPSVLDILGVQRELTLNDFFRDECSFADVLFRAQLHDFVVAGTAEPVPNPAEMLGSSRVRSIIDEVRDRYADRITVFDLSPMLYQDDALAVLPSLDCAMMVVANGQSTEFEVKQAIRHMPSTNFLGAILNKAL